MKEDIIVVEHKVSRWKDLKVDVSNTMVVGQRHKKS